jgi:hypothetical protein
VAGHPLRPAIRRRLGRPSPHQQADRPRVHPQPKNLSTTKTCIQWSYPVLDPVSRAYPRAKGRLLTCYSPVRRSSTPKGLSARLACVKHAASVRPEPGSNSPLRPNDDHPTKGGRQTLKQTNPGKNHTCQRNPKPNNPANPERDPPSHLVEDQKALAFSTLLSSQETDTHHHGSFQTRSGATHLTYHPQLVCQPPDPQRSRRSTTSLKFPHPGRPPKGVLHPVLRGDPHSTALIRS